MILGREEVVSVLFRETDRAQRMKMPLALIKVGIVAWEGNNDPEDPAFDAALTQTAGRMIPLLRCYDVVGRMADREYLLILPGCNRFNATTLAERLRDEVFSPHASGLHAKTVFHAAFGVATSGGRSPFVALREVDCALQSARQEGRGSICCMSAKDDAVVAISFLPALKDDALHW